MNNWWKAGLLGLGGAAALAASGGTLAAPLAGILGGGEGAAGAAAGAAGAGEATAGAAGVAGTADAAGAAGAASAAPAATAFVTPPVVGGGAPVSGMLAGTDMAYGSPAALADASAASAAAPPPSMLAQAGQYASNAGKAASAYAGVSNAMGGAQPQHPAPMSRPVYQGDAPQISQPMQGMLATPQNNFAQMLLAQRQRGMLG